MNIKKKTEAETIREDIERRVIPINEAIRIQREELLTSFNFGPVLQSAARPLLVADKIAARWKTLTALVRCENGYHSVLATPRAYTVLASELNMAGLVELEERVIQKTIFPTFQVVEAYAAGLDAGYAKVADLEKQVERLRHDLERGMPFHPSMFFR